MTKVLNETERQTWERLYADIETAQAEREAEQLEEYEHPDLLLVENVLDNDRMGRIAGTAHAIQTYYEEREANQS